VLIDIANRWTICTPCKAGCMSLEATLRDRSDAAIQIDGRHGYRRVEGVEDRLMIVRHPVDRWVSMYWFIRKHIGRSCYFQEYATSMAEFAVEWDKRCEAGENHWWFYSQAFMAKHYDPTLVFRLEENGVEKICEYLRQRYNAIVPRASHTNRNHHKGTDVVPVDIILKHWGIDYETYYSVPGYRRDGTGAA
jgi:hypothetical protein